jgi:hypothetical protein
MAVPPALVVFEGPGGFDFSGKKVKTPTLPKAGRVGHPKNLNWKHREALATRHPLARFLQLKTLGRIRHSLKLVSLGMASLKSVEYKIFHAAQHIKSLEPELLKYFESNPGRMVQEPHTSDDEAFSLSSRKVQFRHASD